MAMSKRQLKAISYAYSKARKQKQLAELEQRGMQALYKYQDIYKTIGGLLKASPMRLAEVKEQAVSRATIRLHNLMNCYNSGRSVIKVQNELESIKNLKF